MKKLTCILVLVFAFTFTTQAQKKRDQFTVDQQVELAVKKMTLKLDLSERQQNQIKPLIAAKMAERKAFMENRKEARKNKKGPTSDEMFAIQSKRLDKQIAMKNRMKDILNKEQFEKFEKRSKGRKMKMKKKGKKMMKGKKERKSRKEKKENMDN
ncbi:MAG: hypothetical protein V3V28_08395 [Polaribacter sp.]|uniref:hypothetical protein n=1 Tax=Polaribacter sp. TaxID=1920175 RepID=UPI002F35E7C7